MTAKGTPTTDPVEARRRVLYGSDGEPPNHLVDDQTVDERIVTGHGQRPEYTDTEEIRRRIREGDHPEVTHEIV